jgi:hypothetical protein
MHIIDFGIRPNAPNAVDGSIDSPFFRDMCHFMKYPERTCSTTLEEVMQLMDVHRIIEVITGRDTVSTYGCPGSNMAMVAI